MKVAWAPEAEQDRDDVWDYIAEDSETAAARMDKLFSDAAAQLGNFLALGQLGQIAGTRELIPNENYRLVYEVVGDTVWVLALVPYIQAVASIARVRRQFVIGS
jgi:toxin ParE1/3/4